MSLTEEFLTLTGHELGDLPRQDPALRPSPCAATPTFQKLSTAGKLLSQCGGEMKGLAHPR